MKHIITFCLCLAASFAAISQSNIQQSLSVNGTGAAADASAQLDVSATDKGMLVPRMTTAQRDAISNPVPGLMIYNTTDSCFNYYGGNAWYKDCGRSLNADMVTLPLTQGGGSDYVIGNDITADASGNVIVTGYFYGTATFGSTTLTSSGSDKVFAVKYDATGTVLWAKQGGGSGTDYGNGITADASGNVIVTGNFSGTATFGSTMLTSSGCNDVFVVKYDASGTVLWAKQGGGSSCDYGNGITADASGNVMVTGYFSGTATFGSTTLTSSGNTDVFAVKYDAGGTVLWAKQGGGSSPDRGNDVTADASGNVIVTGYFEGTATFGSTTLTSSGNTDVFAVKYDAGGIQLWALRGGGSSPDRGNGVTADASGNVMVTGNFFGTATFGSTTLTSSGNTDVFAVKYDAGGTVLWAKQGGGSFQDFGNGITADAPGNVIVTGFFSGTATFGSTMLTSSGCNDVFVVKYDASGTVLWAKQGGGSSCDYGNGITADASGNVMVTGYFSGTATFGSTTLTSIGIIDVFVSKYNSAGSQTIPATNLSASQENDPQVGVNTINYLPKWNGTALVKSSSVFENGSGNVGIGTTTPTATLELRSATPSILVGTTGATDGALYFGNTSHGIKRNYSNINDVGLFTASGDVYLSANGTSTSHFVLKNNGNVGIGTTVPQARLDVNGEIQMSGAGIPMGLTDEVGGNSPLFNFDVNFRHANLNTTYRGAALRIDTRDGLPLFQWIKRAAGDTGPGSSIMELTEAGKLGIGRTPLTNLLEVEGDASKSSAGDWLANSDARLKKNIRPLDSESMLAKMLSLQGVTYEWNDDQTGSARPAGIQYGFTAQNIREAFPTLVSADNLGYLQTAYGTYDAMTVEAIRALNDKITALESLSRELGAENEGQKTLLDLHEKQLETQSALLESQAAQLQKISAALLNAGISLEH